VEAGVEGGEGGDGGVEAVFERAMEVVAAGLEALAGLGERLAGIVAEDGGG
jgi:hypothetical protein